VPTYLVEEYGSELTPSELNEVARRAHRAARQLACSGTPVRWIALVALPSDQTCLHLYEASEASAVHEAVSLAAITVERLTEATYRTPTDLADSCVHGGSRREKDVDR